MRHTFREFVRAIHGRYPFPWQERAAEALCVGAPLEAISVPTGTGKTSMLDAAVFAMAHGQDWRRIVYTVDRRLVVDSVSEHAQRVADALAAGESPAISAVAAVIGRRLRVVRLRGGVPLDDEWVLHPEEPAILVSTVDQAGSRLLFRGYGVSAKQAPIHAALVGHRALHLVDEAHLSRAYVQTLRSCREHGAEIAVIEMTATPSVPTDAVLALEEADRTDPALARRLNASKRARLIDSTVKKLSATLTAQAMSLRQNGAAIVGVVVNTVARAREVYGALAEAGDAVLLTGRVRSYERDQLVAALLPSIRAGRDASTATPLYVVATQTIEVGADLDFDALVTECASVSALRQRFGRLDRLGTRGTSDAAIVFATRSDKVYGSAYDDAWQWLQTQASQDVIDFGIDAFGRYPAPPAELSLPTPPLAPSHLDLLSITGTLAPQIDITPWLHGVERPSADVSIVWRADLDADSPEHWGEIVGHLPPIAAEALALPIHIARAWLGGAETEDVADIATAADATPSAPHSRRTLRWDGEQGVPIAAREIRPGDTLVVPATYGGCDDMGWNPASTAPVGDLAEAVRAQSGRPLRQRLHPALTSDAPRLRAARHWAVLLRRVQQEAEGDIEALEAELETAESELLALLAPDGPIVLEPYPDGTGAIALRVGPEFGQTLNTGIPVGLDEHLEGVGQWARQLASALGEDTELFAEAGRKHDAGKAVTAFQNLLHGSPIHDRPLAKSGLTGTAARAAWLNAGLPRGFRHEAASLTLTNCEAPLLRHLVGAHHGHGRPWFPLCDDPAMSGSALATVHGGWLEQFFALRAELRPWRLAWLEALLRVADARRSIEEQSA